jgi:pyruvate/2-oxoglutarate dehydrogenase complex dihydrolipoamide dehydrogenase (E3) component
LQQFGLIIIGAGSGLDVANAASRHGLRDAVIERDRVGGICITVLIRIAGTMDKFTESMTRLSINLQTNDRYFTTITGQCEYVTTPKATLPSNNLLKPVLPRVPITINFTLSRSA